MSGGRFEYQQYRIENIAVEIDEIIARNDDMIEDDCGELLHGGGYSPEIIEKFREAAHTLRQAAEMAQRVDWLVSGDDGDESFLKRWAEEVRPHWVYSSRQIDQLELLAALDSWADIAHDKNRGFVKKFCPHAWILTSVTWDSENMRFVYILKSGQHVCDSVKITEWLEFLSDDANGSVTNPNTLKK